MTFSLLVPYKAQKANKITLALTRSKTRRAAFFVSVPTTMAGAWDKHDTVDVLLGDGEDAGRICIKPNGKKGNYKITRLMHTCTVRLAAQDDWIGKPFSGHLVNEVLGDNGTLIFELPKVLFEAPKNEPRMTTTLPGAPKAGPVPSYVGNVASFNGKSVRINNLREGRLFTALTAGWGSVLSKEQVYIETDIDAETLPGVLEMLRKSITPLRLLIVSRDTGFEMRAAP